VEKIYYVISKLEVLTIYPEGMATTKPVYQ